MTIAVIALVVVVVIAGTLLLLRILHRKRGEGSESITQSGAGVFGEILSRIANKHGGKVYNDVRLRLGKNNYARLDHVYVCKGGVFVCETIVRANAVVSGSPKDEFWMFKGGQAMKNPRMASPLIHVLGNAKHLAKALELEPRQLSPYVILFHAKKIEVDDRRVLDPLAAAKLIDEEAGKDTFSEEEVSRFIETCDRLLRPQAEQGLPARLR